MRPPTRNTRSTRVYTDPDPVPTDQDLFEDADANQKVPEATSTKKGALSSGKIKKSRHRMTNQQLDRLEALYQKSTHPSRQAKQELGDEVGMDIRTVTVWFQNRRQIAKKTPDAGASAVIRPRLLAPAVSRPPLALVSHRNVANSQKVSTAIAAMPLYPATVAVLPIAYPFPQQTVNASLSSQSVQPQDLWKYIPSSPSTCQQNNTSPPTTPGASEDSPGNEDGDPSLSKRKRTLEWACTRLEKRQRMYRDPQDAGSGNTTDDDSRNDGIHIKAFDPLRLALQDSANILETETTTRKIFEIPPEYHAKFPPDIVLGASLLLTLKHSG